MRPRGFTKPVLAASRKAVGRGLLTDLQHDHSRIRLQLENAGLWLAQTLQADASLRASLNARLENAILNLAPDIGAFLQAHISRTLGNWDSERMVAQIETQVGSQLQSIRINGTLLGGLIGLALWGLSLLAATWQAAAAALPQLIAR